MSNLRKKLVISLFTIVLALTMCITIKVFAQDYGSGDIGLSFDFSNNAEGFTVNSATVNTDYNWTSSQDKFKSTNGNYTIVVNVTAPQGKTPRIQWGGNFNNHITQNAVSKGNNVWEITLTATSIQECNPDNPSGIFMGLSVLDNDAVEPPGPNEPHFDGKAYLIWSCNGGICYHYFDNIPAFDDGNSYFIKDTTITADNNPGKVFDMKAQYKGWADTNNFNSWVTNYKAFKHIEGDINWANVDPKDMLGDPIDMRQYEEQAIQAGACTTQGVPEDVFHECVDQYVVSLGTVWAKRAQLQPLNEPTYNNAYVSYGDRNFKTVVYNDNYKGISIGDLTDLDYYPATWTNAYLRRDQFDISGTTPDKPTYLDAILLQKTLKIKTLNYNNYEITKLEALDVPEGAVTISKDNSGQWVIDFSSNFYDNVLFKATDSNGVSYFKIKRYTIDAWIRVDHDTPYITSDFFFKNTMSYEDFDISAKIIYKDGTEKNVKLNPVKRIDDGLGNITEEYEVDEENPKDKNVPKGKGLKKACFEYELNKNEDRNIQDIYMFIEYKGSTAETYAGTFAGSGKGVLANLYHGEDE